VPNGVHEAEVRRFPASLRATILRSARWASAGSQQRARFAGMCMVDHLVPGVSRLADSRSRCLQAGLGRSARSTSASVGPQLALASSAPAGSSAARRTACSVTG